MHEFVTFQGEAYWEPLCIDFDSRATFITSCSYDTVDGMQTIVQNTSVHGTGLFVVSYHCPVLCVTRIGSEAAPSLHADDSRDRNAALSYSSCLIANSRPVTSMHSSKATFYFHHAHSCSYKNHPPYEGQNGVSEALAHEAVMSKDALPWDLRPG